MRKIGPTWRGERLRFEIVRKPHASGVEWAIRAGVSKFLVCEGSGWSIPIACEFLAAADRWADHRVNRPVGHARPTGVRMRAKRA